MKNIHRLIIIGVLVLAMIPSCSKDSSDPAKNGFTYKTFVETELGYLYSLMDIGYSKYYVLEFADSSAAFNPAIANYNSWKGLVGIAIITDTVGLISGSYSFTSDTIKPLNHIVAARLGSVNDNLERTVSALGSGSANISISGNTIEVSYSFIGPDSVTTVSGFYRGNPNQLNYYATYFSKNNYYSVDWLEVSQ